MTITTEMQFHMIHQSSETGIGFNRNRFDYETKTSFDKWITLLITRYIKPTWKPAFRKFRHVEEKCGQAQKVNHYNLWSKQLQYINAHQAYIY